MRRQYCPCESSLVRSTCVTNGATGLAETQHGVLASKFARQTPLVSACGTFMKTSPACDPAIHSPSKSATQYCQTSVAANTDPGPLLSFSRYRPAHTWSG